MDLKPKKPSSSIKSNRRNSSFFSAHQIPSDRQFSFYAPRYQEYSIPLKPSGKDKVKPFRFSSELRKQRKKDFLPKAWQAFRSFFRWGKILNQRVFPSSSSRRQDSAFFLMTDPMLAPSHGRDRQWLVSLWSRMFFRFTLDAYHWAVLLFLFSMVPFTFLSLNPLGSLGGLLSAYQDNYIDTFLFYFDQTDQIFAQSDYLLEEENLEGNQQESLLKQYFLHVEEHVLKEGETLSHLASRYGVHYGTLISYNRIKDVRSLRPGRRIFIPNMNGVLYTVQEGDSLSSIAEKYKVSPERILDINDLDTVALELSQDIFIPGVRMDRESLQEALGELFILPARGIFTDRYGYRADPFTGVRQFHSGLDVANRIGTSVVAARAGTVVQAGNHPIYGIYVVISHSGRMQTLYGHLQSFRVNKGQWVDQGDRIGSMGSTGYSTGSHLHFMIFKNGQHVNPIDYIR